MSLIESKQEVTSCVMRQKQRYDMKYLTTIMNHNDLYSIIAISSKLQNIYTLIKLVILQGAFIQIPWFFFSIFTGDAIKGLI